MQILTSEILERKIERLALEIVESNYAEKEIVLIGVNTNGLIIANKMSEFLAHTEGIKLNVESIRIDSSSLLPEVVISEGLSSLKDRVVVLIDDVANTGKTLWYSCKPLMDILPKRVEIAVIVDRKHKNFPVHARYVGITLATTIGENVRVVLNNPDSQGAYLE